MIINLKQMIGDLKLARDFKIILDMFALLLFGDTVVNILDSEDKLKVS